MQVVKFNSFINEEKEKARRRLNPFVGNATESTDQAGHLKFYKHNTFRQLLEHASVVCMAPHTNCQITALEFQHRATLVSRCQTAFFLLYIRTGKEKKRSGNARLGLYPFCV